MALIIFDMDGVLSDSFNLMINSINKFSFKYKFAKITKDKITEFKLIGAKAYFSKYKISKTALLSLSKMVKKDLTNSVQYAKPFPGIKTLLKKLSLSHNLCVLSSNSKSNIKKFIQNNKLPYFSNIYSSDFFGKATMLKKIKNKYSDRPAFYVGDEDRDIQAAKKSDLTSVAVSWGLSDKRYLQKLDPDYIVDKPIQIFKIINSE